MPRQDGRHFLDDILKCISLNENGDKPLSEPIIVSLLTHIYMRHSTSMSQPVQCHQDKPDYRTAYKPLYTAAATVLQIEHSLNAHLFWQGRSYCQMMPKVS